MNIITRYIIKELLGPFFFSLNVIMFIFITKFIVQYIGKLFGRGLPISTVFEFVYLNVAWMLALAVPMSVLIASLMAFGRLSADNEITILKSSGINLYRIIRPALIFGVILFVAMVWFNDKVLPEFNHRARQLHASISRKKPTLSLEKGLYLKENKFNILVKNILQETDSSAGHTAQLVDPNYERDEDERLEEVTIFDASERDQQRTITAEYGYLLFDPTRGELVFHLYNGEIHELDTRDFSEYRRATFAKNIFYIPAKDRILSTPDDDDTNRGDREMSIAMMREKVQESQDNIAGNLQKKKERVLDLMIPPDSLAGYLTSKNSVRDTSWLDERQSRVAVNRASQKANESYNQVKATLSQIKDNQRKIFKYEVEIHKKYSIPFACIVFVLVGASLGIKARRGSLGVGFAFSIGFFLIYWICLIGGEELADRQLTAPALAMWFPNIIVGIFGLYLTYSTVRETESLRWERMPMIIQKLLKARR